MKIPKAVVVLNGFIHDFATGYWFAAMIVIYYLNHFQGRYPDLARLLASIEQFFFWNTIGAAVVIVATGAGRTFTYVDNVFGEQTEQTRRKLLIVKHIILFCLFGSGCLWAYTVTYCR